MTVRDQDVLLAHCAIELWAFWHNFARSFYLACAFRARDGSGQRIALGIPPPRSEQEALSIAIQAVRPTLFQKKQAAGNWDWRDEPDWKVPKEFLDAFAALQASNTAIIQGALSSGTRTWLDLPTFRNFFAHRDKVTLQKAQARFVHYGHSPNKRPGEVLSVPSRTAHGTGWQPLLLDWIDDFENTITFATA